MRNGSGRDKVGGIEKSHQATRRLRPPGSELSGKAGREVLKVLVSEPKGSPDLTPSCIKVRCDLVSRKMYVQVKINPKREHPQFSDSDSEVSAPL
jgi:hypothetical protein